LKGAKGLNVYAHLCSNMGQFYVNTGSDQKPIDWNLQWGEFDPTVAPPNIAEVGRDRLENLINIITQEDANGIPIQAVFTYRSPSTWNPGTMDDFFGYEINRCDGTIAVFTQGAVYDHKSVKVTSEQQEALEQLLLHAKQYLAEASRYPEKRPHTLKIVT
jgi:hypothetical protein